MHIEVTLLKIRVLAAKIATTKTIKSDQKFVDLIIF